MRAEREVVLIHNGHQWFAEDGDISASAITLAELEKNIKTALGMCGRYKKGETVTVLLGVDTRIMPAWIRPYQSHYFNRYVTFQL